MRSIITFDLTLSPDSEFVTAIERRRKGIKSNDSRGYGAGKR